MHFSPGSNFLHKFYCASAAAEQHRNIYCICYYFFLNLSMQLDIYINNMWSCYPRHHQQLTNIDILTSKQIYIIDWKIIELYKIITYTLNLTSGVTFKFLYCFCHILSIFVSRHNIILDTIFNISDNRNVVLRCLERLKEFLLDTPISDQPPVIWK